jgi:hypothetical protein
MGDSPHQDGQRKEQPDDKSNSGTPQNREDIIPAGDSDGWPRILETLGVFIFGGFGVGLTEAGFHFWAFLCDFLAVGCGIGLVCHHVKKSRLFKRVWLLFWPLIFVDFLVFSFLLWHVQAGTEKPYPHFTFSIVKPGTDISLIELTNGFLFERINDPAGVLVFPTTEKSNAVVDLFVKNDGPGFAEYAVVKVSMAKEFSCVADPGWERGNSKDVISYTTSSGINTTNSTDVWAFELHDLLPGWGKGLPYLRFSNINSPPVPLVGILLRTKDSPSLALAFEIEFFTVSTNASTQPFFVLSKKINGHIVFSIPAEKVKELLK